MAHATVQDLVEEQAEWGVEEWWRLDLRLFADTPRVQHALVMFAPPAPRRHEYTRFELRYVVQSMAYLFGLIAPLIGAALMARWASTGAWDSEFPLAAAGILTAASLAVTAYSEVQARRYPRAASQAAVRQLTLMHIVPGAVTVIVALWLGGGLLSDGAWIWLAVIAIDVAVHIVQLVRGPVRPGGPQNLVDNVRVSVAELSDDERARLRIERGRAISRLRERGLIDDALAARADATDLGMTALTIAPPPLLELPVDGSPRAADAPR